MALFYNHMKICFWGQYWKQNLNQHEVSFEGHAIFAIVFEQTFWFV